MIDFSLPGQPGTDTANKIDAEFHAGGKTQPFIVSVTLPPGQSVASEGGPLGAAFSVIQLRVPNTWVVDEANTGDTAFRTKDGRTAYALVFYRFLHDPTATLPTDSIRSALTAAAPSGATVGVTGEDALAAGNSKGSGPGVLAETFLGGLILLLPLTYLTHVSFIVEFLVALIGLGVAIDYSLIFVTRWREERDHGHDNHDAVVTAMETAERAAVFSGFTVAIGLLALVVLPVPFMRSIGIGGALIPLASVFTTVTLTPAILGGIGPRVDWPKIRHENRASRLWSAWASGVVKHRVAAAGVALLALGLLFGSFLGIKIGVASSASLAKDGPAYTAVQALETSDMSTGALTPMEILVDTRSVPAMVFAFLFGLSMDYGVFILARIREEYDRSGSTDRAVVEGIGRTGRLVTSAALILFLAFVALASGPGTDLKTFATALGFGILLDASIVRSILVPALVSLFGEWNWWIPHRVAQVLRVSRPAALLVQALAEVAVD